MSTETPPLPDVNIREQQATDAAAVGQLVSQVFGEVVVADLEAALAASGRGFGLVAEVEGGIVGQVRLTTGWLDAPDRLVDVLILSPLGVATQWQNKGVGRALVNAALDMANERHAPLVFLEGDPAYYSRLGFVGAATLGCTRPSVRIPEPAFQVMPLAAYETSMTGAVVYPDIFWQYDCVGLRDSGH